MKAEIDEMQKKIYDFATGIYEEGFNDGLVAAWDAARKIADPDGFTWGELEQMFDTRSLGEIFHNFTAAGAIERIEAYEGRKVDGLRVGDEVRVTGLSGLGVVVKIENAKVIVLFHDGSGGKWDVADLTKTGRHSGVITALLKEMSGENDGKQQ